MSDISIDPSDQDVDAPGIQIIEETVVTYLATASDPEGDLMTWTWYYSVNGGSIIPYLNGFNEIDDVTFAYSTDNVGDTYEWFVRVFDDAENSTDSASVMIEIIEEPAYCGDGIVNNGEECDGVAGVGEHQECSAAC